MNRRDSTVLQELNPSKSREARFGGEHLPADNTLNNGKGEVPDVYIRRKYTVAARRQLVFEETAGYLF